MCRILGSDREPIVRIDEKNAEPRLFFPNGKTAFTLTSDDIKNQADALAVEGVTVYHGY